MNHWHFLSRAARGGIGGIGGIGRARTFAKSAGIEVRMQKIYAFDWLI